MAYVEALHIKSHHGGAMRLADSVTAIAGRGIETDIGANLASPRQVLVVRGEDLDEFNLPVGYLRENICLRGTQSEAFAPGALLVLENDVEIFLGFNCEPCKTIAERVPNLKSIMGKRGLLGLVTKGGSIRTSDLCELQAAPFERLSDLPADRVLSVIKHVPAGRVIDYSTLLVAAGLQGPYFRVMPKYLLQGMAAGLPVHRVVDSAFRMPAVMSALRSVLVNELIAAGFGVEDQAHLFRPDESVALVVARDAAWHPNALELLQVAAVVA